MTQQIKTKTANKPTEQTDAYDKLKRKFNSAISNVKKSAEKIASDPRFQETAQKTGATLETAARKTVNSIDAGVQKLRGKITSENIQAVKKDAKKALFDLRDKITSRR